MADQGNKRKPLSFLFPYWTNPSTSQQRQPQRAASRAPASATQQTRRQSKPQRAASTSDTATQQEPEPQTFSPPPTASQTELPRRTSRSSSGTALPVIRTKTRTPSVPSSPRGAAAQSPVSSPFRTTDPTTTQASTQGQTTSRELSTQAQLPTRAPSQPELAQTDLEQLPPVNATNQVPPVSETSSKNIISLPTVSELPEAEASKNPGLLLPDSQLKSVPQESIPKEISEKFEVPNKPPKFDDQHMPPIFESQSLPRMSEPEKESSNMYDVPSEPTTSSIEVAKDNAIQQLNSISQSPEPLGNSVPTEQNSLYQPTQLSTLETKPSDTKEDASPDIAKLKTLNEIQTEKPKLEIQSQPDSQLQPLPQSPFSMKESLQMDELPAQLTSYPSEVASKPVKELEYSPTLHEYPKETAIAEPEPTTNALEKLKSETEDTENEPVGKEEQVPETSFSQIFKEEEEVPDGNKEGIPSLKNENVTPTLSQQQSQPQSSLPENGTLQNYEVPNRISNTAKAEVTLMQQSASLPTSLDPLEKPKTTGDPVQNKLQEMELNEPLDSQIGESEQVSQLKSPEITKLEVTPDKSRGENTTSEEHDRHGEEADQTQSTVVQPATTMSKVLHSKPPQTGQLEKQPTVSESLSTFYISNEGSNNTKMLSTRDSQHHDGQAALQKEIKDGISSLMKNLASKFSEHTGGDLPLCIITLAGENKGASMIIGKENANSEAAKPVQRSYNLSQDSVRSRPTNDEKQQDENSDYLNGTDRVSKTSINSNTQSINNSILQHSSCSEVSPGVHLTLTARSADLLNLKEQMDTSIVDKA